MFVMLNSKHSPGALVPLSPAVPCLALLVTALLYSLPSCALSGAAGHGLLYSFPSCALCGAADYGSALFSPQLCPVWCFWSRLCSILSPAIPCLVLLVTALLYSLPSCALSGSAGHGSILSPAVPCLVLLVTALLYSLPSCALSVAAGHGSALFSPQLCPVWCCWSRLCYMARRSAPTFPGGLPYGPIGTQ